MCGEYDAQRRSGVIAGLVTNKGWSSVGSLNICSLSLSDAIKVNGKRLTYSGELKPLRFFSRIEAVGMATSKSTASEREVNAPLPILSRPLTVAMLWLGASFISFAIMIELPARSHDIDFSHYYASAFALRNGLDPYAADLAPIAHRFGLDIADIRRATYPRTFVLCFEPFTLLPPGAAY